MPIRIISSSRGEGGLSDDLRTLTDYATYGTGRPPSREEALTILAKYNTGITLHLAPNLTDMEIGQAVSGVISQYNGLCNRTIPDDCKHVIVAHGVGRGDNWVLMHMRDDSGRPIKVKDYVGDLVPEGERALCVICSDDKKENIPVLEGNVVISTGANRARGA